MSKAYIRETASTEAVALIKATAPPIPFPHLLELEIRNALRLKHGRRDITEAELRGALGLLQADLSGGILSKPNYDLASVFHRAEGLSAKNTARTLARSADILHVATACEIGCKEFVSFDERQRKVAAQDGLKVFPRKLPALN